MIIAMALAVGPLAGCSGSDGATSDEAEPTGALEAGVSTTAAAGPESGTGDANGVFPADVLELMDEVQVVEVPGGGRAAVGRVCRDDGSALLYAGVDGVDDGLYTVSGEGLSSSIVFTTSTPDPGRGFGAAQMSLDATDYVLEFTNFEDVSVTIRGSAP
jgi:hypothetical protein